MNSGGELEPYIYEPVTSRNESSNDTSDDDDDSQDNKTSNNRNMTFIASSYKQQHKTIHGCKCRCGHCEVRFNACVGSVFIAGKSNQ